MSSATFIALFILALFFYDEATEASSFSPPFAVGSRTLLQSIDGGKAEKPDYAVELNATNFDSVLRETSAAYAVVEFFANWCPACRNYKPQYEKVAKIFNGAEAAHPGIISLTRVDCALKLLDCLQFTCLAAQINTDLCNKFSIDRYPMLLWGPPSKFVSSSWNPKQENSGIHSIDDGRTADQLLNWINKQMSSSYHLDDEKYENDQLQRNGSDIGEIARAIHDIEEATSTAFEIILEHKMIKPETQASLVKFFQLLVVHHPSRRCRKGTAEILVDFDKFSANKKEAAIGGVKGAPGKYLICGKDVPRGYWMFCRGSKNETRGFSCGLWVLLHSLSVRVDDGESQMAFTTICDYIHSFFICQECRQHFYNMCSSVSTPFKKARDFVLWLWDAHNKVNERLMKEEKSLGTADPEFPKIIWPPRWLCPSCYLSGSGQNGGNGQIDWDFDEVYMFLNHYYGTTLVTIKDKDLIERQADGMLAEDLAVSAHAVVVPVGAALAIAISSCAFGALACYWRQRQKRRKYRYHVRSVKNV